MSLGTPRPPRLVALAAALSLAATTAGGCTVVQRVFGAGRGYLLQGVDVLSLPGEKVELVARLEGGTFLRDKPGQTVVFRMDGREIGRSVTDDEGLARVPATAPDAPGDYRVEPAAADPKWAARIDVVGLLLAVRDRDEPFLVTDLDKTVVAGGMKRVLAHEAEPQPDAARVLGRVQSEKHYSIIYLSHRPDFMGKITQDWLAKYGFPHGPLMLAGIHQAIRDSGTFKARRLAEVRTRFPNLRVGLGDQVSDIHAYEENHIPLCVLVLKPARIVNQRRRQARELDDVPPTVNVVTHWKQVEEILFDRLCFPRPMVQEQLRNRNGIVRPTCCPQTQPDG